MNDFRPQARPMCLTRHAAGLPPECRLESGRSHEWLPHNE